MIQVLDEEHELTENATRLVMRSRIGRASEVLWGVSRRARTYLGGPHDATMDGADRGAWLDADTHGHAAGG